MAGYIITVLLTVISGVLVFILQSVIKDNKELRTQQKAEADKAQAAIMGGVMALLKIQLIEYHDKYMTQEVIPKYVYENFDDMYKYYKALGGNGVITKMKEDMDSLKLAGGKNEGD